MLAITDMQEVAPPRNALERWAAGFLRDERDIHLVRVMARMTFLLLPVSVVMVALPTWLTFALAPLYLLYVFIGFGGPYVLMLHAMVHRPTFKKEVRFLEHYVPWVLGPLFGSSPNSFFVHHMGMHHPENNLLTDQSSTLCYERDRFSHFLHYWLRFFVLGYLHTTLYLRARGRHKLVRRLLIGELSWFAMVLAVGLFDWAAALVVLVIPFCLLRFVFMCGNWAQHAFVVVDDPDNAYRNSTNLINTPYNHRCYNDGYHIVHHLHPSLHWTEMPARFLRDFDKYRENDALVFVGIRNNQKMFWLLMAHRYERIAESLVRYEGDTRTEAEIVEMLKRRVRRQAEPVRPFFTPVWNPTVWESARVARRAATT